jgi:hypothetical protein
VEIRRVSKIHTSGQILSLDLLLVTPALQEVWDERETMEGSGLDQDDIKHLEDISK